MFCGLSKNIPKFVVLMLLAQLQTLCLAVQDTQNTCEAASGTADKFESARRLKQIYERDAYSELESALSCNLLSNGRLKSGDSGAGIVYEFYRNQMQAPALTDVETERVKRWRAARPNSIFSEFALLRLNYSAAWTARSGQVYSRLTLKQRLGFSQGMLNAEMAMSAASPSLKETPIWHMLNLAILQDMPQRGRKSSEAYALAIKKWPYLYELHEAIFFRLNPRWGETWENADAYADKVARSFEPTEGTSFYARLYLYIFDQGFDPSSVPVKWEKLRPSLSDLVKRYPTEIHSNYAVSLACINSDWVAYKEYMLTIKVINLNYWFEGTNHRICATYRENQSAAERQSPK